MLVSQGDVTVLDETQTRLHKAWGSPKQTVVQIDWKEWAVGKALRTTGNHVAAIYASYNSHREEILQFFEEKLVR